MKTTLHSVNPVIQARRSRTVHECGTRAPLLPLIKLLSSAYLRFGMGIQSLALTGAKHALTAYQDFDHGKTRLIIAFRHAYGDEPQLLAHALLHSFPHYAQKYKVPLNKPVFAHFLHGYEVPLWGGPLIRFVLPGIGAIPVHHIKMDTPSIRRIRKALVNGMFPLALAPEGQTSYTSRTIPRLERGISHIAAWGMEDLAASGRTESVHILPLSIHYHYGKQAKKLFDTLMQRLETALDIQNSQNAAPNERLDKTAEAIVQMAERYYELHHKNLYKKAESRPFAWPAESGSRNERWARVLDTMLLTAEQTLGLGTETDLIQRVYKIRYSCWDRIYLKNTARERSFERALQDRSAGEAWYAMRHMECADIGYYLNFDAFSSEISLDTAIETAHNFTDVLSRFAGGNFSDRSMISRRQAVIAAAPALDAGKIIQETGRDKRKAAELITTELHKRFLDCIQLYEQEHHDENK